MLVFTNILDHLGLPTQARVVFQSLHQLSVIYHHNPQKFRQIGFYLFHIKLGDDEF